MFASSTQRSRAGLEVGRPHSGTRTWNREPFGFQFSGRCLSDLSMRPTAGALKAVGSASLKTTR